MRKINASEKKNMPLCEAVAWFVIGYVDLCGRKVKGVGLRPLDCCDRRLESR